MAFKPIDPKRDELRRYLERSGVIETFTKMFVRLVESEPENPLQFLKCNLGPTLNQMDNIAKLQNNVNSAKREIHRLNEIIEKNGLTSDKPEYPIAEGNINNTETIIQVNPSTENN